MKAVILAAGVGTRLKPITNNIPKCLVKVMNKPILQYQIESYLYAGIKDLIIVAGYLSDKIEVFLQKKYFGIADIKIIYNENFKTTNNMYSLYLTQFLLNDCFIVSNADVVMPLDMIKYIVTSEYENCIAVQKNNYNNESMKIKVDRNVIRTISKTINRENSYGTSIDIYRFGNTAKNKLFNIINEIIEIKKDKNLWTEVAINMLVSQINFYPLDIKNRYWYEIDNFEDLKKAEEIIREKSQNE